MSRRTATIFELGHLNPVQFRDLKDQIRIESAMRNRATLPPDPNPNEYPDVDIVGEDEEMEVDVAPNRPENAEASSSTKLTMKIPPVRQNFAYVDIKVKRRPQPGWHMNRFKCSLCRGMQERCLSAKEGMACFACIEAKIECECASEGAAPRSPSTPRPSIPDPHLFDLPTSAIRQTTPSDVFHTPPLGPSPQMDLVPAAPFSPTHRRGRSSPGRNTEVTPVSIEGVTNEIRNWRLSTERHTEALKENTQEMRNQREGWAEVQTMLGASAAALRENTSELRKHRKTERDLKMDYGDRAREGDAGGSQLGKRSGGGGGDGV